MFLFKCGRAATALECGSGACEAAALQGHAPEGGEGREAAQDQKNLSTNVQTPGKGGVKTPPFPIRREKFTLIGGLLLPEPSHLLGKRALARIA